MRCALRYMHLAFDPDALMHVETTRKAPFSSLAYQHNADAHPGLKLCCRAFGNLVQPFIVASFTTPTWGSTIANAFLIIQV